MNRKTVEVTPEALKQAARDIFENSRDCLENYSRADLVLNVANCWTDMLCRSIVSCLRISEIDDETFTQAAAIVNEYGVVCASIAKDVSKIMKENGL